MAFMLTLFFVVCMHVPTLSSLDVTATRARRTDDVNLESLMTLVQQQAATIQRLEASQQAMQSQMVELQRTVHNHSANLGQLNTQVYFATHMSAGAVNMGTSSPVKFDVVDSNTGDGYNAATGVFTAPVSGVYVLYAQLMKRADVPHIHWAIDKSGTVLCMNSLDANNPYDKSSCQTTTCLQKGDHVFVRRNDGDVELEGYWWCAFSGFLLSMDG